MTFIEIDTELRRVRCLGRRVHHGAIGAVMAAVGLALAVHDWADRRVWFGGNDV